MFAVVENQIVAVVAQARPRVADNPFDGVKVGKFRVAVLFNLDVAAAQELLQIGLDNVRFRPVKNAVIVVAREVNHFAARNKNAVVIIKPAHALNSNVVAALGRLVRPNFRRLKIKRQRLRDNVHALRKSLRIRKISALNSFSRFCVASP